MDPPATRYLECKHLRIYEVPVQEGGAESGARAAAPNLRVEVRDEITLLNASFRKIFPATSPNSFLSLQDASGSEFGILRSIDELDPESQETLCRHLDRRYFTPEILAVESLKQDGGMWLFVTHTQRGISRFYVRNWRESAHETKPGRWLIMSTDGQRCEIPDWNALDDKSKSLLEQLF